MVVTSKAFSWMEQTMICPHPALQADHGDSMHHTETGTGMETGTGTDLKADTIKVEIGTSAMAVAGMIAGVMSVVHEGMMVAAPEITGSTCAAEMLIEDEDRNRRAERDRDERHRENEHKHKRHRHDDDRPSKHSQNGHRHR